jgi:hypothetical protein
MFLFSWRGVVAALVLIALFGYLSITGRYSAAQPWIDGALAICVVALLIRSWLR